ncbi:MAG: 5-deoxy-glucuronate isomerase [Spirochaetaceae bacterium]|jgi:mannose-6-phosphate isomerase-like protein (cupin superfamily)|nr:5-deoxy-glucuronate isomerase [Spirochaetaceae bacterium]
MENILDGQKYNTEKSTCVNKELFNQANSNLNWLSASDMKLQNSRSSEITYKNEETLIANLKGDIKVIVDGKDYSVKHYDMLYIPIDTPFTVSHKGDEEAWLYLYRATGDVKYETYHADYEACKKDEERIRYLNKKVVYKMFDVSENANKFMVGYTFYEDRTRAWPPHNHTDQEEVYSFIEGHGAMEVYKDDENKTFVPAVEVGDHITIPILNYHPVFSHEEPLCFIWCIAGERYWVGDKNKDFMTAKVDKLTT